MEERVRIRSFSDLEVFQRSYKASIVVNTQVVPSLPEEERYDLKDQLRRSSKAVPRLIAEGFAKKNQKRAFQKYLEDALCEVNESIVSLNHAKDLYPKSVDVALCEKLIDEYDQIGKMIYRLSEVWTGFSRKSRP
ncbi:four helix bundle protein [Candidatus Shapirobacteria bacterium]|nr:four helix bundle protein [Candidatus Shapirobacteria bacterium]